MPSMPRPKAAGKCASGSGWRYTRNCRGRLLVHTHIATVPFRVPPGAEPCDLGGFFRAIVEGGYDGRVSIKGNISKPDRDLRAALSHMKALEKEAR